MRKLVCLVFLFCSPALMASKCETLREIYVENAQTKVWKTTICPHHKLPFHNHQYARIVIPEENGILQVIYRSGKKQILKLQKQTPIYLSAAEGKESHQDLNLGNKPVQVTVIELRKG